MQYREPYPAWIVMGMDVLAAGILVASFRDAWWVVSSLGEHAGQLASNLVAAAVVLAIDASILLLEQARSQVKIRGGSTRYNDIWVGVLILLSALLNVRYLTASGELIDRVLGGVLGAAIPSTIAVLGYLKGDMLVYNAQCRLRGIDPGSSGPGSSERGKDKRQSMASDSSWSPADDSDGEESELAAHASEESTAPFFRINR